MSSRTLHSDADQTLRLQLLGICGYYAFAVLLALLLPGSGPDQRFEEFLPCSALQYKPAA